MSSQDVLNTKLYIPPTRPDRVSRARLLERLNKGLHHKLTLISAPAGFGKTTLVTDWLEDVRLQVKRESQADYKIAWLSLDENDNDLARFLTYFVTALNYIEGIGASFGKGTLRLLQSSELQPIEVILTPLINEIAGISNRMILVLDDYHLIDAQPIHDALDFLLDNLPPRVHLVIATRVDPPISQPGHGP
jgi:LuxR family maltose regulon positive regulatory protein